MNTPSLDLGKIRARLESAQGPLYWKSLEELADTEEFQAFVADEFPDRTPDWNNAAILEPVRASYRTGESIEWTRVNALPDFVYFNHSIHINKGVGCATCHGRVDQMPLMYKENTLYMNWCINCHRNPEKYVRPRDQVFNMAYEPPANQEELGRKLVAENHIQSLTDCYTCHR